MTSKSTSVFHALGSYADRIKDKGSKTPSARGEGSASNPTSRSISPSPGTGGASMLGSAPAADSHDDGTGVWETVKSNRGRSRQDRKKDDDRSERSEDKDKDKQRGSNSRNWRERDDSTKDKASATVANDERPSLVTVATKTAPPSPAAKSRTASSSRTPASASQSKAGSAWGGLGRKDATTPTTAASSSVETPTTASRQGGVRTEPSSPSAAASTAPISLASPELPNSKASKQVSSGGGGSKETGSAETSAPSKADGGENWRSRPRASSSTNKPTPAPKKAAGPPVVNAWDARKKSQHHAHHQVKDKAHAAAPAGATPEAPAHSTEAHSSSRSQQVGVTSIATPTSSRNATAEPNSDAKTGGGGKKMKKKTGGDSSQVADTNLWPDVTQAAAETTSKEVRKPRHEKKESDSISVTDDSSTPTPATPSGKKQKWTPIPAAELQEAADKHAETNRRQVKGKQRTAKHDPEEPKGRGKKGPHHPHHEHGNGGKKDNQARVRAGSQSGIRLPPLPFGQQHHRGSNANGFRPSNDGAEASHATAEVAKAANGEAPVHAEGNGSVSAPMSRQASQQSKVDSSPSRPSHPLSPQSQGHEFDAHTGNLPGSSSTGTLPQHGFTGSSANLPRPPRSRDREGRGGYGGYLGGGRGRGYRASSAVTMGRMYGGELSPLSRSTELANLYQQGFGMGYNAFYPIPSYFMAAGPALASGDYDAATQAYAAAMPNMFARSMPPPPLPVTQAITSLDPLRYYVLGQVEYYFSMQNLAMDFFLRQQMDSEGWIDIPMIASFNRIKSLTPDVNVVREVMQLSSLLEVSEDRVRLAGGEAKRWVLPDAKPSKIGGSGGPGPSPRKGRAEQGGTEVSHGIPEDLDASVLGLEDIQLPTSPQPRFDVEKSLMKSNDHRGSLSAAIPIMPDLSGASSVPSAPSLQSSDAEGKTAMSTTTETSATSVTGDGELDEELSSTVAGSGEVNKP